MALSNSFFKRSLAAALAMSAVSMVSARAEATNLAGFSVGDFDGKTTSVGSFGAGYNAAFTADYVDGAVSGQLTADAQVQLFGSTMTIAAFDASASLNSANSELLKLQVDVATGTIYEESIDSALTLASEEYCLSFFDVSTTFTIVVVPVTMAAGAEGCVSAELTIGGTYVPSTNSIPLNIDVTPQAKAELTASVGVGSSAFSAGVEAEVTLLDLSFNMSLDPTYYISSGTSTVNSVGSLDLSMLDGSVSLYAKADLGFWDVKYTKELFSWEGPVNQSWSLWSTGKPSAADVKATVEGGNAKGTYSFSDTADTPEGNSTYKWYRASNASGSGSTQVSTSKTKNIVLDDSDKYLKFCVTPKNNVVNNPGVGDEECSDWQSVGKVASFYQHNDYSGNNLAIAYQKSSSGTCFNLDDYDSSWENYASSYKLYAPSDSKATFHMYKAHNCSDTSSSEYMNYTVSANSSYSDNDMGSSWNDRLSSIKVIFNEIVTAEDVSISISGNKASSAYTFNVSNSDSTTESGSTYVWKRANDSSGSGATTISGSTGSEHTLGYSDDQKYLQVCVTPSNGWSSGSQVCSGWTAVGHLLKMFEDSNNSGNHVVVAWEKSARETCFNMTDYGFNDKMSSYNWYNNSVGSSTVWFYKDANCSGTVATRTVAASSSENVTSISTTMGSAWQDSISSFKISWSSSVAISTPTITIAGNAATESHTYSGGGYSEQATYTWYRATSSDGDNSAVISNDLTNTHTLTGEDKWAYLMVCVHSSNGIMVDESEVCSDWTYVGPLLRLWANSLEDDVNLNIAYERTASGTCFNLDSYGYDDLLSYLRLNVPTAGTATAHMYKDANCSGTSSTFGSGYYGTLSGEMNNAVSSVKIVY